MAVPRHYATGPLRDDAQRLTATLARDVGEQAAVAWVHAGALVQHASWVGLITPTGDLQRDVEHLAALHPGLTGLTDPSANPMWSATPKDPALIAKLWAAHDVSDHPYRPDGYLLGDLYQQINEQARRGRALCQTPQFVTDLLLDVAYDHAYREHGPHLRMIDPSCGTGHILVETLIRTYSRHLHGPGRSSRDTAPALPWRTPAYERISAALQAVHGVDIDPYAVLLARYRLLVMAHGILGAHRAGPSPEQLAGLPLNVSAADSLLSEDEPLLQRGRYHAVIANPPYITPKDAKANAAIRARYKQVCNGQYSLALPFHQLMNELLVPGGWCAQLTANSFMKREFGKRYIEDYLAGYDLRWAIDTSGAYIPGHGTPTVILVNRNQPPTGDTVRTVMSKRGEPSIPSDPAKGLVWQEIARAVGERESMARLARALTPEPAHVEPPAAPFVPVYSQPNLFDLMEGAA